MTLSFRVVMIIMHKMANRKATATHVWGHNSSILARMQSLPRTGRSLIVVQSLGVQIVCIRRILFELCIMEKKKKERKEKEEGKKEETKKKERRRRKPKNKIKLFAFDFLYCVEK